MSETFKYNEGIPYGNNYDNWKYLNDKEYKDMNMKPYSDQESIRVFNELYGNFAVKEKLGGLKNEHKNV